MERNLSVFYDYGATNFVKNNNKDKRVYGGYGTAFDEKGLWSLGNGFAKNVVIFGVDDSSSSHADNSKNNFLMLDESPTSDINGRFGSPEKWLSINFSKVNTTLCLSLHYNNDNNFFFVNGKKSISLKLIM